MHYKNGREAKDGDPVIGKAWEPTGPIIAGTIHSISAGSTTCNCTVAQPVPGGVTQHTCRNVSDFYHAEDGVKALEAAATLPAVQAGTAG